MLFVPDVIEFLLCRNSKDINKTENQTCYKSDQCTAVILNDLRLQQGIDVQYNVKSLRSLITRVFLAQLTFTVVIRLINVVEVAVQQTKPIEATQAR